MKTTLIALAAAASLTAGAAQALTVSSEQIISGTGDIVESTGTNTLGLPELTITFDRTTTSGVSMRATIDATNAFELFFTESFSTNGTVQAGGNVYAYAFAEVLGSTTNYFTSEIPNFESGLTTGDYDRISENGYDGTTTSFDPLEPDPNTPISYGGQTVFGPGTYQLSFFDSSFATEGETTFTLSAVPLPPAALLLGGLLGGLAWRARRKAA
jgi:hypothetical protein